MFTLYLVEVNNAIKTYKKVSTSENSKSHEVQPNSNDL